MGHEAVMRPRVGDRCRASLHHCQPPKLIHNLLGFGLGKFHVLGNLSSSMGRCR